MSVSYQLICRYLVYFINISIFKVYGFKDEHSNKIMNSYH